MFGLVGKKLATIGKYAVKSFAANKKNLYTPTGLTYKRLNAVFGTRGLEDMLLYRSYEIISYTDNDKQGFGVFTMADGRRGFIVNLMPQPYLGASSASALEKCFKEICQDGNVVHILSYASSNLGPKINAFRQYHHASPRVGSVANVRAWVDYRAKSIEKWTSQSMMRNIDCRARDFIVYFSVLLPYGTSNADIIDAYRTVQAGLQSEFSPRAIDDNELLSFCNEIFKPSKPESWNALREKSHTINHDIGRNTSINITNDDRERGTFCIDKSMYVQTLSTVRNPNKISLINWQCLFGDVFGEEFKIPIPSNFLVAMTISVENKEDKAEAIFHKSVSDITMMKKVSGKDLTKNPQFSKRYNECNEAIIAIKEEGQRIYPTMLQIFIFEKDLSKLDRFTKAIKDKFLHAGNGGWVIDKEEHPIIGIETLLYSLPLMYNQYIRDRMLKYRFASKWTSNNANTAPVLSDGKGFGRYDLVTFGRTGQIQRIDWYDAINYNVVIIGPMGTGKTMLLNEITSSCVAASFLTRVFDLGEGMKQQCLNFRGKHIDFNEDKSVCFNFFTHVIEVEKTFFNPDIGREETGMVIDVDELSTIVPMIGLMCKQNLKSSYSESAIDDAYRSDLSFFVQEAVITAHRRRGREAGMKDVGDVLKENRSKLKDDGVSTEAIDSLIRGLAQYTDPAGQFYSYVNGPNNIDTANEDLAVFEFEYLRNKGDLLFVAQAGIMQRLAVEYYYKPRELPKAFILDEAKVLALDNPIMVSYLEDFALRMRKYNVVFVQATQSANHYHESDKRAKSMFELADWKIFLQHDEALLDQYAKNGLISMNPFRRRVMRSVRHYPPDYSEFYLLKGGYGSVCRLKIDSYSYWLYTSKPEDKGFINDTARKLDLSTQEAILYIALTKDGVNEREALDRARQLQGGIK